MHGPGSGLFGQRMKSPSSEALLRSFRRAHPLGSARVPGWCSKSLSGRKLRTCIGAPSWQADFTEESYRHLRDIYPDLCDAVIARHRHQPIPIHQRAQAAAQGAAGQASTPAQPQQQASAPSSTTTVSTIKAAAPSAAQTQAATGPGDQAAAPSAAVPPRTTTESPSRPSSYPPATAAGRSSLRRKRTPPARRQPSLAPARKASTRRPRSRTPLRLQLQAQQGRGPGAPALQHLRPVHPPSGRPLILAPANCAYLTTRVDSAGIWILQHRYEGAPRPTRRAPRPVRSDEPYDLPDLYWHHPPRAELSSNPPRGHGGAEHYNLSESPPPERSAQAVYSGRAAFNPDRVYEAEQVSIKRPAPAGRDSSTAPATKTARIVFAKRESQVKAPPQSVLDQAAADRAASKAIPPPPLRAPPAPPAPVPRAAAHAQHRFQSRSVG